MAWDGKTERRASPRVSAPARVKLPEKDGIYLYSRNMSADGAFLEGSEPLAVGTRLSLELAIPGVRPLIPVVAEVVRQADDGVGVKFIHMQDEFNLLLKEAIANMVEQVHPVSEKPSKD